MVNGIVVTTYKKKYSKVKHTKKKFLLRTGKVKKSRLLEREVRKYQIETSYLKAEFLQS